MMAYRKRKAWGLFFLSLLGAAACGDTHSGGGTTATTTTDTTPPEVQNLTLDLPSWDPTLNGTASDSHYKFFIEFGGKESADSNGKTFYQLLWRIPAGTSTTVFSPIVGVVKAVESQPASNDFEIRLQPNANSVWEAILDHVTGVSVSVGASVAAGQAVGKAATGAYYEFNIKNSQDQTSYCPLKYMESQLRSQFQGKLSTVMSNWENFKSDAAIYNESAMVYKGCRVESGSGS